MPARDDGWITQEIGGCVKKFNCFVITGARLFPIPNPPKKDMRRISISNGKDTRDLWMLDTEDQKIFSCGDCGRSFITKLDE